MLQEGNLEVVYCLKVKQSTYKEGLSSILSTLATLHYQI